MAVATGQRGAVGLCGRAAGDALALQGDVGGSAADGTLSRQQILERWPTAVPSPEATTLWKWLRRAVERGRLTRHGNGHKGDPFRYGLAGRSSSLLPPLPDLAPLENEVPLDGKSLTQAAKALAVLEELRRREAERDANRGEGNE